MNVLITIKTQLESRIPYAAFEVGVLEYEQPVFPILVERPGRIREARSARIER